LSWRWHRWRVVHEDYEWLGEKIFALLQKIERDLLKTEPRSFANRARFAFYPGSPADAAGTSR
jgi:hypothetical protein